MDKHTFFICAHHRVCRDLMGNWSESLYRVVQMYVTYCDGIGVTCLVELEETDQCPRCKVEERDGSRPITYDGKTWAR